MSAVKDEETLLAALGALHSSSTRQQKEEAHSYLDAFQKKVMKTCVNAESSTNAPRI